MLKIAKVEVGDLLIYSSGGNLIGKIIGWFSGGDASHVSMVVGFIRDNQSGKKYARIAEAHQSAYDDNGRHNRGKVHEKTLSEKWYPHITIRRVHGGLTNREKEKLVNDARCKDVGKVDYDLGSFPSMFVRSRIGQLLGWAKFRLARPKLNDPVKQVCSTYVANRYRWSLAANICREVNPHSCTPLDLLKTKSLTTI